MSPRLPPLTTLPSFEAAARLLSFSKAADELHVTHGAVSRAIKNLEDQLGVQLFERGTRSVRLTPVGESYAHAVREILSQLNSATAVATARYSTTLNINTSDGFAGRWLVPRLYRFYKAHDDIDIRVSTRGKPTNFMGDGIDMEIRYGSGVYPGLTSELLTGEEVFPVCSPKLLSGEYPLGTPEDLRHHTLIHHGFPWSTWLESVQAEGVDSTAGIFFDSPTFAMESAAQGEGVVLGRTTLVSADIAAGRLVRPFAHGFRSPLSFFLVYPPQSIRQRKVRAFRDWLLSEILPSEGSERKQKT